MRSLPHIVFACGVVWGASRFRRSRNVGGQPWRTGNPLDVREDGVEEAPAAGPDFRLIALGSLLPDLVDKTLGRRLYRDELGHNDHTYGHTALFHLGLLALALPLRRKQHGQALVSLATGSLTHLLLDPVIRSPRALLWPLLGTRFPRVYGLGTGATLASQGVALAVALAVLRRLASRGELARFVRTGAL